MYYLKSLQTIIKFPGKKLGICFETLIIDVLYKPFHLPNCTEISWYLMGVAFSIKHGIYWPSACPIINQLPLSIVINALMSIYKKSWSYNFFYFSLPWSIYKVSSHSVKLNKIQLTILWEFSIFGSRNFYFLTIQTLIFCCIHLKSYKNFLKHFY